MYSASVPDTSSPVVNTDPPTVRSPVMLAGPCMMASVAVILPAVKNPVTASIFPPVWIFPDEERDPPVVVISPDAEIAPPEVVISPVVLRLPPVVVIFPVTLIPPADVEILPAAVILPMTVAGPIM